jgi:ergothioneine biosynthesis protein EgtB
MTQHLPLSLQFIKIRNTTEELCKPLSVADYSTQIDWFASPPKWHLAHTTWFFESFILEKYYKDYQPFNEKFSYLFNSYYISMGERLAQANRGGMAHPKIDEIYGYRKYVSSHIERLLEEDNAEINNLVILGLNHEQQHQELLLSDIKYNWGNNYIMPTYCEDEITMNADKHNLKLLKIPEGIYQIGHEGNGFCYDNELAKHKQYINGAKIAQRLVTNREYAGFIEDGGYDNPLLWLSDGWKWRQENNITKPLYWIGDENEDWQYFTLYGMRPLDYSAPVSHISYYEAKAFARWADMRLPTEFEWEVACKLHNNPDETPVLLESGIFMPTARAKGERRFIGNLWEWTESAYLAYPGYKQERNALGEYNGKFMANQMVLRGGCFATPTSHIRRSYRNFYYPDMRWMFSGIRLAKDND